MELLHLELLDVEIVRSRVPLFSLDHLGQRLVLLAQLSQVGAQGHAFLLHAANDQPGE